MRHILLAILCNAMLGSVACTSSGMQRHYEGSPPALTAEQVKTLAHAAAAMHLPAKVRGAVDHPIMKTAIGNVVPDLPERARGAAIGDMLPNEQQILARWDYYYWLNNSSTLVVTAEHRHTGFVITGAAVKSGRLH